MPTGEGSRGPAGAAPAWAKGVGAATGEAFCFLLASFAWAYASKSAYVIDSVGVGGWDKTPECLHVKLSEKQKELT